MICPLLSYLSFVFFFVVDEYQSTGHSQGKTFQVICIKMNQNLDFGSCKNQLCSQLLKKTGPTHCHNLNLKLLPPKK